MTPPPVSVIGLGPMGRAMATTLMDAGHPTTVWNRTPSRADALVAAGAQLAESPADALAAAELTILSLTDYSAMYDILGAATGELAGTTLVNLSSDTPDATREAAAWAAEHGGRVPGGRGDGARPDGRYRASVRVLQRPGPGVPRPRGDPGPPLPRPRTGT